MRVCRVVCQIKLGVDGFGHCDDAGVARFMRSIRVISIVCSRLTHTQRVPSASAIRTCTKVCTATLKTTSINTTIYRRIYNVCG